MIPPILNLSIKITITLNYIYIKYNYLIFNYSVIPLNQVAQVLYAPAIPAGKMTCFRQALKLEKKKEQDEHDSTHPVLFMIQREFAVTLVLFKNLIVWCRMASTIRIRSRKKRLALLYQKLLVPYDPTLPHIDLKHI